MKVIKNFKIILRQGYIFRDLKKRGIEISKEQLFEKLNKIQAHIKSATVYETFNPDIFRKKINFGKPVVVSLFVVTVGNVVETIEKDEIFTTAIKDALFVAKNFILKLIQKEAEEDHCGLTEIIEVEPSYIFENRKILAVMDFSKIGVKFENGIALPENTKFFVVGQILKTNLKRQKK
ncbi:MAG: hypothetical protein ABID79_00415 [Elusimicrobiota bacterium]